jgi:hypothetical protein
MVRISSHNNGDVWKYSYHIQCILNIYQTDFRSIQLPPDLLIRLDEIKVLDSKDKIDSLYLADLLSFCRDNWKKLITFAVTEIESEIETRKTKGERFSDILLQLKKIKDDLIDISDYKLEWFENTYNDDICGLRTDTKERIELKK